MHLIASVIHANLLAVSVGTTRLLQHLLVIARINHNNFLANNLQLTLNPQLMINPQVCPLACYYFFSADVTLGVNRKTDTLYLDSALCRTQDMSSSKLGNGRSRIFANRKLTCYQSRKP